MTFDEQYFNRGFAVGWHHLSQINHVLKKKGFETVDLLETDVSTYGKSGGPDKGAERQKIRDELLTLPEEARDTLVKQAREARSDLLPPIQTHETWKARREDEERQRAVPVAQRYDFISHRSKIDLEQAVSMLNAASNVDLKKKIIEKLGDSELAEAAELIEDPAVRDLLIEARLDRMT